VRKSKECEEWKGDAEKPAAGHARSFKKRKPSQNGEITPLRPAPIAQILRLSS
jgi:hypothetical protein